ncbi:MAG: type IVB secretion system lipoprotein DotD [Gammaproteobacteria bacterium]|nr:type IVB secretion system lipoprotein DotD [Gammaproteobacteria bacterium]
MKRLAVLFSIILFSLGGCKTINATPPDSDPAEAKLAEAADSISHSLVTLAEIQQAQLPKQKTDKLPDPEKLAMSEVVSVDWSGPVEPFLRKIGEASGYQVRVLGVKPPIPIIVTLTARNTPLSNVLRDTAFQCMTKADVFVYPCKKLIELRYAKS